MLFRVASNKDIKTIQNIIFECGKDMKKKYGYKHWEKKLSYEYIEKKVSNKEVYILNCDENNIATFSLSKRASRFFDDECNNEYLYLSKLAVLPNKTRRGIGRICIQKCEEIALENNKKGIRLDVYIKSEHAIKFYTNNDFKKKFTKYTGNFEVICMEKII